MHTFELADTVVVELNGNQASADLRGADLPTDSRTWPIRAAERVLARVRGARAAPSCAQAAAVAPVLRGSSNAAATIQALAALLDTGWSRTEMAQLGQKSAATCRSSFTGPPHWLKGVGSRVTPLQLRRSVAAVGEPRRCDPDRRAYERLQRFGQDRSAECRSAAPPHGRSWRGGPQLVKWHDLLPLIENDFAPVMNGSIPCWARSGTAAHARCADSHCWPAAARLSSGCLATSGRLGSRPKASIAAPAGRPG